MIRATLTNYLADISVDAKLEHPTVEKFGDYAVRGDFDFQNLDIVEKVDKVAGFSNIWLKTKSLVEEANKILSDENKVELAKIGGGKKVIVEYSSPNIAKSFGIGHLRSTNIGQAIYNIHQILGWETIGDNHLGDWGTQFGKMICAIKRWGDKSVETMSIQDLEKLYVKFHLEIENDNTLENEGREWFAKLEKGDQEAREIWQKCVDISLTEFNRVYDLLGVKIDNAHGEAFFENMLPQIVEDLKKAGLTKVSNGALIVEFSDMSPAILLKSDGATTYFTRDLATIKYRINKWKPDKVVYEVGSEQILHFRQVFRAAEMMGWVTPGCLYHLPHGLLRWSSGKFSTRSGDTIHLADVIDKAITEAKKIAPKNSEDAIKTVAIGAIKFNDLSSDPRKDVVFDWERVMSMEGSSGPYLQYSYARCKSVLAKSKLLTSNLQLLTEKFDEDEKALLRYFYIFNEKIVEAGERMSPAVIAEYLLSLARKYNEFYAKCRIVGEPAEERRLFLTQVTAKIIKDGLGILGIETLEKM